MSKFWALNNLWELNPLQVNQLSHYYLLHWTPTHLVKQLIVPTDYNGLIIYHRDLVYRVVLEEFSLNECLLDKSVRLSFRKHPEDEQGVVMIKRNQNVN